MWPLIKGAVWPGLRCFGSGSKLFSQSWQRLPETRLAWPPGAPDHNLFKIPCNLRCLLHLNERMFWFLNKSFLCYDFQLFIITKTRLSQLHLSPLFKSVVKIQFHLNSQSITRIWQCFNLISADFAELLPMSFQ